MRRLFYNQALVLVLFLGITAGNALPYAQLYQIKTAKIFSCHCCDHGKVNCPHCAKYGHKGERQVLGKRSQKKEVAIQETPCSTSQQNQTNLNFSPDPFVMVPVQPILFRPQLLRIPEKLHDLSAPQHAPPTPPPQFVA